MTLIESCLLSVIDALMYILLSNALLKKENDLKKLFGFALVFGAIVGIISTAYHGEWYSPVLSAFVSFGMMVLLHKKTTFQTIYLYLISTVILMVIQSITLLPTKMLLGELAITFEIGAVAQTVNLILSLFVIRFIPISYLFHFVLIKNRVFEYIVTNAFVTMFLIVIYWNVNIDSIIENLVSISALSLVIIFINFGMLKNSLKNETTANKLKAHEQYLPVIDELISDIRTRQHDFKNHIQALGMMVYTSKSMEEVTKRFEEYTGQLANKDELNTLLQYQNKIIAGFLYGKKAQAEANNIKLDIYVKEEKYRSILHEYEWIEILGVLIDNAIEARNEEGFLKEISVTIDKEKDMNLIVVKNKHPYLEKEIMKNIFNKGFSSKSKTGRGYGLYNVRQIVNKYRGSIEAYNEDCGDNYVVFKVLLP